MLVAVLLIDVGAPNCPCQPPSVEAPRTTSVVQSVETWCPQKLLVHMQITLVWGTYQQRLCVLYTSRTLR